MKVNTITLATGSTKDGRAAYSISEIVQASGLGRSTVYEAIGRGDLRARKCNARTIVLADDFAAWLTSLPLVEPKSA